MNKLPFFLFCFLFACTSPTASSSTEETRPATEQRSELPPSGTYEYDFASDEYGGQPNGGKLRVSIDGDRVKIIYLGGSGLGIPEGEVLDEGLLVKHTSGKWIVAEKASDKDLEAIGDCAEGPAIIDFVAKKYFWC